MSGVLAKQRIGEYEIISNYILNPISQVEDQINKNIKEANFVAQLGEDEFDKAFIDMKSE